MLIFPHLIPLSLLCTNSFLGRSSTTSRGMTRAPLRRHLTHFEFSLFLPTLLHLSSLLGDIDYQSTLFIGEHRQQTLSSTMDARPHFLYYRLTSLYAYLLYLSLSLSTSRCPKLTAKWRISDREVTLNRSNHPVRHCPIGLHNPHLLDRLCPISIDAPSHPWPNNHTSTSGKLTSRSWLGRPNTSTSNTTPIDTLHYGGKGKSHLSSVLPIIPFSQLTDLTMRGPS